MCTMQTWLSCIRLWKSGTCCKNHLSNENKNASNAYRPRKSGCLHCLLFPPSGQQIPRKFLLFLLLLPTLGLSNTLKCSSQLSLSLSWPPVWRTAALFPYISLSQLTIYGKPLSPSLLSFSKLPFDMVTQRWICHNFYPWGTHSIAEGRNVVTRRHMAAPSRGASASLGGRPPKRGGI